MVVRERTTGDEIIHPPTPTTLDLFDLKGERLHEALSYDTGARRFTYELARATPPMKRLGEAATKEVDRYLQMKSDLQDDVNVVGSSITVGKVYLQMQNELTQRGLTPQEIMNFFSLCIDIACDFSANDDQFRNRLGSDNFHRLVDGSDSISFTERQDHIVTTKANIQPPWFHGNHSEWMKYIKGNVDFTASLYPDLQKKYRGRIPTKKREELFGRIERESLPDWLTEGESKIPHAELVEEELQDDLNTFNEIQQKGTVIDEKLRVISIFFYSRHQKACARFETKRRGLEGAVESFPDLISFLHASTDVIEYIIDPQQILAMGFEEWDNKNLNLGISSDKTKKRMIETYSSPEKAVRSLEAVALWIERKLQEGKIITNAQLPIAKDFGGLLTAFMQHLHDPQQPSQVFQDLRAKNKRAYRTFMDEIKPLFAGADGSGLDYLDEFIHEAIVSPDGKTINTSKVILELAHVVVQNFKEASLQNLPPQSKTIINKVGEFMKSWLTQHAEWAYGALRTKLTNVQSHDVVEEPEQAYLHSETAQDVKEITQTTAEVQRSDLSGWNLFYLPRRRLDDHVIHVEGETMEEIENYLERLFLRQGISCSVSKSSIVNTLAWIAKEVPQEVEQIGKSKDIEGTRFKKVPRGAIRIFYIADRTTNTLSFFVYQKKAWGYGF